MLLDLQQNVAIRPLDFVATVGNAANFYIAKEFSIDGSNLFIGADENALAKSLLLAALEGHSNEETAVVVLIWQETEQQRVCHALLLGNTLEKHNTLPIKPELTDISELSTINTPLVIDINL